MYNDSESLPSLYPRLRGACPTLSASTQPTSEVVSALVAGKLTLFHHKKLPVKAAEMYHY